MKHLLKLMDLSHKEILEILNLADQLKYEKKYGIEHHYLKGKTLGMIFQKSSTRTRVSFEVGMYDLGGSALFFRCVDEQQNDERKQQKGSNNYGVYTVLFECCYDGFIWHFIASFLSFSLIHGTPEQAARV